MYSRFLEIKISEWFWKVNKRGYLFFWLGFLFKGLVVFRNQLYDRKILSKKIAPIAVVSIGNVVAGGVGKTQLTIFLVKELLKAFSVSILSRGYRSDAEKKRDPFLVETSQHSPKNCGDEPWLMAARFPRVPVIVGRNRYAGAVMAQKLGVSVAVLDDGMQHRKLHRDFEIVVIDASNPFGGGHFLPRGMLREDPGRLKEADLIVCMGKLSAHFERELSLLTSAPCVEMSIQGTEIKLLTGEVLQTIRGVPCALFCGIGNPERFVRTITDLGGAVIATHFLPDHREMKEIDLNRFAELAQAKGAKLLLCTEKDAVKLNLKKFHTLPIGWLEVELKIENHEEIWKNAIGVIKQRIGGSR